MVCGHDANAVWWAMGSLICNLTVRHNLAGGRCTTEQVDLQEAVANARKRDGVVTSKRKTKKARKQAAVGDATNKELALRLRRIEKQLGAASDESSTSVDVKKLLALLLSG